MALIGEKVFCSQTRTLVSRSNKQTGLLSRRRAVKCQSSVKASAFNCAARAT